MKSKLLCERTNCFFATKNVIQFAKRAAKLILTLNFKVKKIFFLLHCILFIRKLELFPGNSYFEKWQESFLQRFSRVLTATLCFWIKFH